MQSQGSTCNTFGVVEGFVWPEKQAYRGQHAQYDHKQRRILIQFMSAFGLNVYIYDPKVVVKDPNGRYNRAVTLLSKAEQEEWAATYTTARLAGVQLIWGLTPPDISYVHPLHEKGLHRQKLDEVIEQLTGTIGLPGVALLWDDVPGAGNQLQHQARLMRELSAKFPGKIKACCMPSYGGVPVKIQNDLDKLDVPPEIPYVFTGRKRSINASITATDLPHFAGRKIVLWDNWIAIDRLRLANFCPFPPLNRDASVFSKLAGYWLNLSFPVERVFPAVATLHYLKANQCSPATKELPFQDGKIADLWALAIGCPVHLTRTILKVKLANPDAWINPNPEDIVATSDLHSIHLLVEQNLPIRDPVRHQKTLMKLAVEVDNYPLARFIAAKGGEEIDWAALKVRWVQNYLPAALNTDKLYRFMKKQRAGRSWLREMKKEILEGRDLPIRLLPEEEKEICRLTIKCIQANDLKSVQDLIRWGFCGKTNQLNGKTLRNLASTANHEALVSYLKAIEEFEEVKPS